MNRPDELAELFNLYRENALSEKQAEQLHALLRESPEALKTFRELLAVDALTGQLIVA